MKIKKELKKYIEANILPQYLLNDQGHGIEHINYVIKRSFELSENNDVDPNIIYTVAAFHDIGHHINHLNHEKVSARIAIKDQKIKTFFSHEELNIIKEAIEDHRA